MENIIWEYRYLIIFVIAGVAYSVNNINKFKNNLYKSIIAAKQLAKDKVLTCGKEQEDWVVSRIQNTLPSTVKIILTEKLLREIIRNAYKSAMDYLDDGKLNDSFSVSE